VLKSLFMVQLLSRKNKKGAAFFVRQRLPVLYLVVYFTAILLQIE